MVPSLVTLTAFIFDDFVLVVWTLRLFILLFSFILLALVYLTNMKHGMEHITAC